MTKNKAQKNKKSRGNKARRIVEGRSSSYDRPGRQDKFSSGQGPNLWMVVFLFFFLIIGYFLFYNLVYKKNPLSFSPDPFRQQIEEIMNEREDVFDQKYKNGYKIIVIKENQSTETHVDTLPKELKVSWSRIFLSRIPPDVQNKRPNLVEITIPVVRYIPSGDYEETLIVGMDRQNGSSVLVKKLGAWDLYAEIIEAYENQLICLFGFR